MAGEYSTRYGLTLTGPDEPTCIICFGDSITEALEVPPEQRWPTRLQNLMDELWPGGFAVINRGIGNETSVQGFDRLASDVLPLLPGVLLVEFGLNDANVFDWARVPRVSTEEFRTKLREFQRIALNHGGQCVFIVNHTLGQVPGSQGNDRSFQENFAPYNLVIRELAVTLNTPYIDLPSMMAAHRITVEDFVDSGGIHLTPTGNRLYAEMILAGLQETILSGNNTRASSGA